MKIPRQSARSQRSGLSKLPLLAALTVAMGASVAVMPMSAATAAPTGVEGGREHCEHYVAALVCGQWLQDDVARRV